MIPIIVTNNPRVSEELKNQKKIEIVFHMNSDQEEILKYARDKIHLGGKLLMHPMMGRIKPHETPYKSVFMEIPTEKEVEKGGCGLDFTSLTIIEDSINETSKLLNNTFMIKYDKENDEVLRDLAYIDFLLIKAGTEEYLR